MRRLPRLHPWLPLAFTCSLVVGCPDRDPSTPTRTSTDVAQQPPDASLPPSTETLPEVLAEGGDAASDGADAQASAAPEVLAGFDLIDTAKVLFRDAACGTSGPPLPPFAATAVDKHCKALEPITQRHREKWIEPVGQFLASLRPSGLPSEVVYPFGGADLTSALTTYPDALVYTTISLEPTGDVRAIHRADGLRLERSLAVLRDHVARQFGKAHSRTDNLAIEARSAIPGEVAFSLIALAAHGFEPLSLRYFRIEPNGALHYFDESELGTVVVPPNPTAPAAASAAGSASPSDKPAKAPPPSPNVANVELRFRKTGDPSAPVKIFRHVAWNLDDDHFPSSPLEAHLLPKGKVSTMTKAASHLLWDEHFARIRDYLLSHMAMMFSDTTCPPPRLAQAAGFVQDTYGRYEGAEPFGTVKAKDVQAFRALFKTNPQRDFPFRYGYPDNAGHGHLVVTRKP